MDQVYQFPERVRRFLENLRRFEGEGNRAALYALRRGASEATRHLAWPIILRCGGQVHRNATAWATVGAAFAFYPQPKGQPGGSNFGGSCSALAGPLPCDGKRAFDALFRRILSAESSEDLAKWVIQIAKRAKSSKPYPASINYEELLTALLFWDAGDGSLRHAYRRRWAGAYWQQLSPWEQSIP